MSPVGQRPRSAGAPIVAECALPIRRRHTVQRSWRRARRRYGEAFAVLRHRSWRKARRRGRRLPRGADASGQAKNASPVEHTPESAPAGSRWARRRWDDGPTVLSHRSWQRAHHQWGDARAVSTAGSPVVAEGASPVGRRPRGPGSPVLAEGASPVGRRPRCAGAPVGANEEPPRFAFT